jgi:hypothetical protein
VRALVVRLFEAAPDTGQVAGLCGLVEDVRSGASWPFDGDDQLLRVIEAALAGPPEPAVETADQTCWS